MKTKQAKPKVLISALDWGLGHATRIIPIINYFKQENWSIAIASSAEALHLLRNAFPELIAYELPSYKVKYTQKSMMLNMLHQLPKFKNAIKNEHLITQEILQDFKADLIISDNRYGVYSANIPSVIISHQLQILPPKSLGFSQSALYHLHQKMMSPFGQIWVPDFESEVNLGGKLSHPKQNSEKIRYIGPLSRFVNQKPFVAKRKEREDKEELKILAWVSGPEPERENFENILMEQLALLKGKHILLRGLPSQSDIQNNSNISVYNHMEDSELIKLLPEIDLIICRSGYSSIMDLYYLQKKAVFVPTPGQTEQEYLAQKLMEDSKFYSQKQSDFNINTILDNFTNYSGFEDSISIYKNRIEENLIELGVSNRRGDE